MQRKGYLRVERRARVWYKMWPRRALERQAAPSLLMQHIQRVMERRRRGAWPGMRSMPTGGQYTRVALFLAILVVVDVAAADHGANSSVELEQTACLTSGPVVSLFQTG
jgi:hypothetical protein